MTKNKNKQKHNKKQMSKKPANNYSLKLSRGTMYDMSRMPDIQPVKFFYEAEYSANSGLSAQLNKAVRLNSVYDPDLSGIGSQPVGWDQWSAFYNRYRVISTKIEVRVENQVATEGYIAVMWISDSSISYSGNLQQAQSSPGAVWCDVSGTSAGKPINTLRGNYLLKHAYAFNTTSVDTSPELASQVTTNIAANPNVVSNLYIAIFRPDSTSGNISYRFNVKMWFTTELTGRQFLAPS